MTCDHPPCPDCQEKIQRGENATTRLHNLLDAVTEAVSHLENGSVNYPVGLARGILKGKLIINECYDEVGAL